MNFYKCFDTEFSDVEVISLESQYDKQWVCVSLSKQLVVKGMNKNNKNHIAT